MPSRTCSSASFPEPINELSLNTDSNDTNGANKDPVHTDTGNVDAAITNINNTDTTNKNPVHTDTANIDAASTNIDNTDTTNNNPVRTATASIDAASTDIDNADTTNTDTINTDTANTSTADTSTANTSDAYAINKRTNTLYTYDIDENSVNAANAAPAKSTRPLWQQKLRKFGHFLIFG